MLQIEHIHKSFGKTQVLKDISLNCPGGDSIALLGPNGSGKSTLIKTILGLSRQDQGHIELAGMGDLKEIAGYMPQIGRYPENMRIRSLLSMLLNIRNKSLNQCDTELYETFEIPSIAHKKLGDLSGGMKQKVGAVIAFLFHPDIIILDEPTAGLDPISSAQLKAKIQSFRSNKRLVIITSHIISELDGLVNRVIYLMDGTVQFDHSADYLKSSTEESALEDALAQTLSPGIKPLKRANGSL